MKIINETAQILVNLEKEYIKTEKEYNFHIEKSKELLNKKQTIHNSIADIYEKLHKEIKELANKNN